MVLEDGSTDLGSLSAPSRASCGIGTSFSGPYCVYSSLEFESQLATLAADGVGVSVKSCSEVYNSFNFISILDIMLGVGFSFSFNCSRNK